MIFQKRNQLDPDGKKQGYWVTASKANPKQKAFKGWYNHGNETGKCIYFNNGVRAYKIRYINDSLMRIRRYNENGKLEYKGSALWLTKRDEIRFCWHGKFVFYDSHRHVIRKADYILGEEQDLI
jgi:antitoxin component YwqK of YwqJK toxin-antitoxin module